MNSYNQALANLFGMLELANMADSDNFLRQSWQDPRDSRQDEFYGYIRSAIVAIAGEAIVEHWAETGEVDLSLANRNK